MRDILLNLLLNFIFIVDKFVFFYWLNYFYILYLNYKNDNLLYSFEIIFGSCMLKFVVLCILYDFIFVDEY